ncbi:MAG: DUF421 domain-containing protein [Clostridia bacterium]|nr:DUF421 domain-containing protein [Clostridia bacterium]
MFGIDKIYWVFINSVTSFIFLFIISKLLGKKQIAQLEFIDYAVGISLGSIAAEWAADFDSPFYFYAISMAIYFFLALAVALIGRKTRFFKKLFKGKPVTLVYEGRIVYGGLVKSKIDVNDLLSMLREKGFFDVNDVAYAIFETSGKLSVLPKGEKRPVVIEDLNGQSAPAAKLTNTLIADGEVSYSGLREIAKDEAWLYKTLGIQEEQDLKNVILATYDEENKQVLAHYKEIAP